MENQAQNLDTPHYRKIDEEIAELEQKLAEKKKVAGVVGVEAPQEKEIFKEVMREHIAEKKAEISALPPLQAGAHQTQVIQDADELKKFAEEKQLEELIKIAVTKSPVQAAHIAEHLKNPRLLDDLHDYLSDHLYDKLVEARKLKEL